jgi:uncharacterized protein
MDGGARGQTQGRMRSLGVPGFIVLVIAYLALLKVSGLIIESGMSGDSGDLFTTEEVALRVLLPIGISVLFVYAVVGFLGWWRPVFKDDKPVQPWLIVVPIVLVLSILAAINYAGLAEKPVGFIIVLLAGALCVGFAEEGMFRGIGVTVFRTNGFTEGKVALWSSVVFGAAHLTNALTAGGAAIGQAIIVSFAGYFFYLVRRRSGGLVVGALLHGMFDFSLISGGVIEGKTYAGSIAGILCYLILGVILITRRHRIEPDGALGRVERSPAPAS